MGVLYSPPWQRHREKQQHPNARQYSKMGKFARADAIGTHYSRDLERPPLLLSPPRRTKNLDRRTREYLTPAEVEKLRQASSKVGRHGARDRTLILLAYRHGLRVSELVTMR
jgi:site-specific recombinase XerD